MIYCTQCGAQLQDDSRFCAACGTAVSGVHTTEETIKAPQVAQQPIANGNSDEWMVLLIAFVLLCSVAALLAIFSHDEFIASKIRATFGTILTVAVIVG